MYKKGRNYPAFFCLQGVQIVVYRSVTHRTKAFSLRRRWQPAGLTDEV